eukprot:2845502-Rhodomonas_salina.5
MAAKREKDRAEELSVCHNAMPGTDLAYDTLIAYDTRRICIPSYSMTGTDLAYSTLITYGVLSYVMSGTDLVYAATRISEKRGPTVENALDPLLAR